LRSFNKSRKINESPAIEFHFFDRQKNHKKVLDLLKSHNFISFTKIYVLRHVRI